MNANYGTIKLTKGLVGYESELGHGGWWYPDRSRELEIPFEVSAEHLFLWKNQGNLVVFKVPLCVFKPEKLIEEGKNPSYVSVWFWKEDIDEIVNKGSV